MPNCENGPGHYTQKKIAPSPQGRGICARNEPLGSKKRGTDKCMWEVRKAGISQRWFRISKPAPDKPQSEKPKPQLGNVGLNKNKKQISSIKSLMSSAKDRKKRIETVTGRLATFIDSKSVSYLGNVFFGKYSLLDKSGHFRGADGRHFFEEYVMRSRNQMKTGKDLENIMVAYVKK